MRCGDEDDVFHVAGATVLGLLLTDNDGEQTGPDDDVSLVVANCGRPRRKGRPRYQLPKLPFLQFRAVSVSSLNESSDAHMTVEQSFVPYYWDSVFMIQQLRR